MKQNLFLKFMLFLIGLIFLSCSEKEDLITTFTDRTYKGKYRIEDDSYLQYGSVTLILQKTNYEQYGVVEYPYNREFQSVGRYSIRGDTIIFNPTCEYWTVVHLSWFLCGEFIYRQELGTTSFEQRRDSSYVYNITIYEDD